MLDWTRANTEQKTEYDYRKGSLASKVQENWLGRLLTRVAGDGGKAYRIGENCTVKGNSFTSFGLAL